MEQRRLTPTQDALGREPQGLRATLAHAARSLRRIRDDARLRSEVTWIVIQNVVGFPLAFVCLKLLTVLLGREGYGEYSLVLSTVTLAGILLTNPMWHGYTRYYHTAKAEGLGRSAAVTALKHYGLVTGVVTLAALVLTRSISQWFGVGVLSGLAGGLLFLGARWRYLGIGVLTIQRRRRAVALHFTACQVFQAALLFGVLYFWRAAASAALFATAASELVFAAVVMVPLVSEALREPKAPHSRMMHLWWTFGVPAATISLLDWLQSFSDRYILAFHLDIEAVGTYVGVSQVCGMPYVLLEAVMYALVLPIAYQRAKDPKDAQQLWGADKVILGGLGVYAGLGVLTLGVFVLAGQGLVVLLTAREYALPTSVIVVLALGRFLRQSSPMIAAFFAAHHQMRRLLWFQLASAAISVPLFWLMIAAYGILGAALGMCLVGGVSLAIMCLAPGGAVSLVLGCWRGRPPAGPVPQEEEGGGEPVQGPDGQPF